MNRQESQRVLAVTLSGALLIGVLMAAGNVIRSRPENSQVVEPQRDDAQQRALPVRAHPLSEAARVEEDPRVQRPALEALKAISKDLAPVKSRGAGPGRVQVSMFHPELMANADYVTAVMEGIEYQYWQQFGPLVVELSLTDQQAEDLISLLAQQTVAVATVGAARPTSTVDATKVGQLRQEVVAVYDAKIKSLLGEGYDLYSVYVKRQEVRDAYARICARLDVLPSRVTEEQKTALLDAIIQINPRSSDRDILSDDAIELYNQFMTSDQIAEIKRMQAAYRENQELRRTIREMRAQQLKE